MRRKLIRQSLFYYWRTNLAVLLGVAAATAVIGGALVVGDSVRDSLKQMTLDRLGDVDHVLQGQRFFEESLAERMKSAIGEEGRFPVIAPAIQMSAGLERPAQGEDKLLRRAGGVNLYGVDDRLWNLMEHGDAAPPSGDEIVLSARLAESLGVSEGDELIAVLEIPSAVPRDSLLGKSEDDVREIPLTVKTVLDEDSGIGRFGLLPNQQLPMNAFVSLLTLQESLDQDARRRSRSFPEGRAGRVNSLFVSAASPDDLLPAGADALNSALQSCISLSDLRLRIRQNKSPAYLSVESTRLILENSVGETMERLTSSGAVNSPVLVYLVNEFNSNKGPDNYSMYSVIAGLDDEVFVGDGKNPFGPFEYLGKAPTEPLGDDGIIVNEWLAEDLQVAVGDRITVKYYLAGSRGELGEEEQVFQVRGINKLGETPAADVGLTPEVKGITDVETMDEWDQPFKMDLERLTSRDDSYWTKYRGTPKAFVSLATAQKLWTTRYGNLTSYRFVPNDDQTLDSARKSWEQEIAQELPLARMGMVFQPVKAQGLAAAGGTTDFTGLFLGFSFFIILSAAILVALLFRLGIEQRAAGVGLLLALGFTPKQTRNMLLAEGLTLSVMGGVIGTIAAVGYGRLMIYGLKTWWIGAIGTRFLHVAIHPASLAYGFLGSVLVGLIAIWWAMRGLGAVPVRRLLTGGWKEDSHSSTTAGGGRGAFRTFSISGGVALLLIVGVISGLVPHSEAFAGFSWAVVMFFLVGVLLLTAGLALLSYRLERNSGLSVWGRGLAGMGRLSMQNASRNRARSVLTVGLIASATFVVAAVAAGHRNPAVERPDKNSGNGGFSLVAESSQPLLFDLNTQRGREEYDLIGESSQKILQSVNTIAHFRVRPGENASCLNIFQTQLPTILGVPKQIIHPQPGERRFKFADTRGENPWMLLEEELPDGEIPVLGDMNTLQYSLHKGIGDIVDVPNDATNLPEGAKLRIVGMFDGSVFQGQLLMSAANFNRIFSNEKGGFSYFLIDVAYDPEQSTQENRARVDAVAELLEAKIGRGFDTERVSDRLANFLAVQNTYLSTFLALGGLGLLLGTFGLATVMLRNVFERRGELALMRALGFRNASLTWLVLLENVFLLIWGLAAGVISALIAMAPHLLTTGADVPWEMGAEVLSAIFVVGTAAALFAVIEALRTPVLETLRGE